MSGEPFRVRSGVCFQLSRLLPGQTIPSLWAVALLLLNHTRNAPVSNHVPLLALSRIKKCAELCHLAFVCGGRVTNSVQAVAIFSGSGPIRRASQNMRTDTRRLPLQRRGP